MNNTENSFNPLPKARPTIAQEKNRLPLNRLPNRELNTPTLHPSIISPSPPKRPRS